MTFDLGTALTILGVVIAAGLALWLLGPLAYWLGWRFAGATCGAYPRPTFDATGPCMRRPGHRGPCASAVHHRHGRPMRDWWTREACGTWDAAPGGPHAEHAADTRRDALRARHAQRAERVV
ncbi:MAG TPA: hypothetical protein VFN76_10110 [Candidatus Limnocylindria bacterium]|nr:hypothetical protein [Candidatus Limnocylindria bacterium]